MARAHAAAAVIEEAADQETLGFGPFGLMVVDLVIQLGLDSPRMRGHSQVPSLNRSRKIAFCTDRSAMGDRRSVSVKTNKNNVRSPCNANRPSIRPGWL